MLKKANYGQEGCPDLDNTTYVKDTNNRLNQFVSTYAGSSPGKIYEVVLQKKIYEKDEPSDAWSWDMIIGSYRKFSLVKLNHPFKDILSVTVSHRFPQFVNHRPNRLISFKSQLFLNFLRAEAFLRYAHQKHPFVRNQKQ